MANHSTTASKQRLSICGKLFVYPGLAAALGLAAPYAWAAYNVHIDAPKAPRAFKKLLKTHLDIARFAKSKDISDEQLEFLLLAAPRQAREFAKTSGYFSADINAQVATASSGKKTVTLHLHPGPRTTISAIHLKFAGPVQNEAPEREAAARKTWPLPVGDPFTQEGWEKAKNASLKTLQAQRYLGAEIAHSQMRIDPDARQANASVSFDSGPTFTLGPLEISGLQRYPEWIIHHVNPLKMGEIYQEARILELQRQVQNTGYFANVAIEVENDRNKAHHAPVKIQLSEYPLHSIRSGIGYSSDAGARVQAQYLYHNLFRRAWIFDARAALEQRKQYAALQLSMPPDLRAFVNSALGSYERTRAANTD
ncbi:autotransporter assembly complex protein TamA, partial [Candidatus Glomeribacter gigasporarum]|uniref:autotransporter assembly complex protein TamA n=1 Tax=Candidatus Glomeribacter gigasporarum TaxID=132144 RepID=UPI0005B25E0D